MKVPQRIGTTLRSIAIGLGVVLAAVGCGDPSANEPAAAPLAEKLPPDARATVVVGETMSLVLVADDDVVEVQQIGADNATVRARIDAGGTTRSVAGFLDADDQRLELAVDVCPDGLSGVDSEWRLACKGDSALHRITVSTKTWTGAPRRALKGVTLGDMAPAYLLFSRLDGDPLLRANDVSMRFTDGGETLLPSGCGVGDTIYALEQIDPLSPTATTVFDPEANVPIRQVFRYDSTGTPLKPIDAPAEATATSGLSIECSSDAVFMLHRQINGTESSLYKNTDLLRLDGEHWSEPLWTGNIGSFRSATTASAYVAISAMGTDGPETSTRTLVIAGRDGVVLERTETSGGSSFASLLHLNGRPYLLTGNVFRPNLPPEPVELIGR